MMGSAERMKMFDTVFCPGPGERVLLLVDVPREGLPDSESWTARREMAHSWYETFRTMGSETGFEVELIEYKGTGRPNAPIPGEVVEAAERSNLVVAMTEYSASSSLKPLCDAQGTTTRCASMPGVERRMEESAFRADYGEVRAYARSLRRLLDQAVSGEILFSTGDRLQVDLRYRSAESDEGDCTKPGQFINFPSGEGAKVPYEAVGEEATRLGRSETKGTLPVSHDGEIVKYVVGDNKIIDVIGVGRKATEMRAFFAEDNTRRNVAELGIGCNPMAVVSGNVLEDEKVGLHIAYGTSVHLGGKVLSDVHQDIVYARGCPIEATTLILVAADGSRIELISDSNLRYELLK
jgi:hypothetical protein